MEFQDQRGNKLPSHFPEAACAVGSNAVEREPSLTTLRAELNGVHPESFKNGSDDKVDWDPRKSKQGKLMEFQDQRGNKLPSHFPEAACAVGSNAVEREPSLTTLRAELNGVHPESFKNGSDDKVDWDPRKSKQGKLMGFEDHRSKKIPSRRAEQSDDDIPEATGAVGDNAVERDPSSTTLRAELSGVHAESFKNDGNDDEVDWDPRGSRHTKLMGFQDQRSNKLPSHFPEAACAVGANELEGDMHK